MAGPTYSQLVDLPCEVLRGQLFASDLQSDHKRIIPDIFKKTLPFLVPNGIFYCFAGIIRRFFVGHFYDLQLAVTPEALGILRNGIPQIFFLDLPYCQDTYFHPPFSSR